MRAMSAMRTSKGPYGTKMNAPENLGMKIEHSKGLRKCDTVNTMELMTSAMLAVSLS